MSGHSKWANIKNKKGKADAQRGSAFTKLGREIAIAVRQGGADPAGNSRLKDAIAKAKAANLPNDNISRSIKKAAGEGETDNYEEMQYEGYGAGGVAVIVRALTDNKNRTAADIRHIFDKTGGNLGTTGCVSFSFQEKGSIIISKEDYPNEDQVMTDALEAGAEDFADEDEVYEVTTAPSDYYMVKDALEAKKYEFLDSSLGLVPNIWVEVTDEDLQMKVERLIDLLDEYEDVQEVFHNFDR